MRLASRYRHAIHGSPSASRRRMMSTTDPSRSRPTVRQYSGADDVGPYVRRTDDSGYGWVLFAGTMLAMLATLNFIDGVAAVSNSTFFTEDAKFVLSNLNTWGWILIAMSAIQLGLAFGIWAKVKSLRWFGVAIAAANAVVQLV